MKNFKPLLLSSLVLLFTACGTETIEETPNRFDMWNYMTAAVDQNVEYEVYENDRKVDYYEEEHRMVNDNTYTRESSNGLTTLYLNGRDIEMKDPSQTIIVERYVYLGDNGIFRAPTLKECRAERFYNTYERKGEIFHRVLLVECESQSGVIQQFYYGYNEGLVVTYTNNGTVKEERIKVRERRMKQAY